MTHYYSSLVFYIGVSVISCAFIVRLYRKAAPAQRRQIALAAIGALAVPLLVILVLALR
jgi:hypothetical protein